MMAFLLGSLDIGSSQMYSLGCGLGHLITLLGIPNPNPAASVQCLLPALRILPTVVGLDFFLVVDAVGLLSSERIFSMQSLASSF